MTAPHTTPVPAASRQHQRHAAAALQSTPLTRSAQATARPVRRVRQWTAGIQDAAWLARCRELAAAKGLTHAARWQHIASGEGEDLAHELTVPSASFADRVYEVQVRPLGQTPQRPYLCECAGHGWGAPCAHVGAALHSVEARTRAMAAAARDTSSVLGNWLAGLDW